MVRSMTGFGRGEYTDEMIRITVEMKAVNHRYSDFTIKMPRSFNEYETKLRNILKEDIARGKVDVFITLNKLKGSDVTVKYNEEVAAEYISYLKEIHKKYDFADGMTEAVVARLPEVFTLEEKETDTEEIYPKLEMALREALQQFLTAREKEGENLKADMLEKLDRMRFLVSEIEKLSPGIVEEYRNKLKEKIADLLGDTSIDESRIAMEVTMYADKICVDEEITRLKSHVDRTKDVLEAGGAVGRSLDFIIQEMNREANTILSKSDELKVTDMGIELKTLIEKLREQIQNIE